MTNALGIDDELGDVELVEALEAAFEIKFAHDELSAVGTVGALYDILLGKLAVNDGATKCATAMSFYRLRSAIRSLGFEETLAPSSDLSFLRARGTKRQMARIEQLTGLRTPRLALTPVGMIGLTVVVLFAVAGLIASYVSAIASAAFFGVAAAGLLTMLLDPQQLEKADATLGGLSRKVAALNFARLGRMGARRNAADAWDGLLELLSEYELPKSAITRDTVFFDHQLKRAAA